ncbi:MAG: hypothetical protein H6999_12220 [Hahellaceae bacterium]|nr:hypothetical protein [Hahellaceae bacterium]MCP5170507.1 hypothetical protein [Hahellaceae bacterium]
MTKPWVRAVLLFLIVGLSGCSTLFSSYPEDAAHYREALTAGKTAETLATLGKQQDSSDRLLYLLEAARIQQIEGDYLASQRTFDEAIRLFDAQDLEARIRLKDWSEKSLSLLTNDKANAYRGFGYERIFVHYFQALNYLGLNNSEGAAVEFRRLSFEQQVLEAQYQENLQDAYQTAADKDIPVDALNQEHFAQMNADVRDVHSSFLNAQAFVTAASFWEAHAEINRASVDYRNALAIYPESVQIRGRLDELGQSPKPGEGRLLVLFEEGFVPARIPVGIPLPTFDGGLIAVQFPVYPTRTWRSPPTYWIQLGEDRKVAAEIMTNVALLAAKNLSEQMPSMMVRQALRGFAKYELQRQARRAGGDLGQLLASIYNLISEQADLRTWLTLPNSLQSVQLNVAAGEHRIRFAPSLGTGERSVTIREGETRVLRVFVLPGRVVVQEYTM